VLVETRACGPDTECTGVSKRYASCNVDDCRTHRDYREEQCSAFDHTPFERKLYQWVPYLKAPRKCELNCMPKGERFYYRHAKKVVDGTECGEAGDGERRVCVDGECVEVGCDGKLASTLKEDKCRNCGGDPQNCNTVTGVLEQKEGRDHQ
jgi:hypothetical protein